MDRSFTDEHAGGVPKIATTQESVNKIHNLVRQDRRVTKRQLIEDTGYYTIIYLLTAELDIKELSAMWVHECQQMHTSKFERHFQ